MKKTLTLICAVASIVVMTYSCKPDEKTVEQVQLDTPVPVVTSQTPKAFTVTWDAVENATSYVYTLNGGSEEATAELSVTFADLIPGQNMFKLKAVSEDKTLYLDSEWAELTVDVSGEPSLKPESGETLTVPAEAGDYTVKYILTNPVEGGYVTASVEDGTDWITDIDCSVDGEVALSVAENEGLAKRTTVLTVSYEWPGAEEILSFTVDVEQEPVFVEDVLQFITDEAFLHYCQWRLDNAQSIQTLNGEQEFPAWDTDGDGKLSSSEAASVTGIDFGEGMWDYDNMWDSEYVYDMAGLEYFSGLQFLNLLNNYELTSIDLSGCHELVYLNLESASWDLYDLDLSANTKLQWVNLDMNSFETLTLGSLPELTHLQASCYLESIDLSGCPGLETLRLNANSLESVDLGGLSSLKELNLYNNSISDIDLSDCPALTSLDLASNSLTSVDVASCPSLTLLSLRNNSSLAEISVSDNTVLSTLRLDGCALTSLDVDGLVNLITLDCYGNSLSELDITAAFADPASYQLNCGEQTADGEDITLNLIMTDAQKAYWDSNLSSGRHNSGVEVTVE